MSEFSAKFMKNSIDVHGIHLFLIRNTPLQEEVQGSHLRCSLWDFGALIFGHSSNCVLKACWGSGSSFESQKLDYCAWNPASEGFSIGSRCFKRSLDVKQMPWFTAPISVSFGLVLAAVALAGRSHYSRGARSRDHGGWCGWLKFSGKCGCSGCS